MKSMVYCQSIHPDFELNKTTLAGVGQALRRPLPTQAATDPFWEHDLQGEKVAEQPFLLDIGTVH